MTPEIARHNIEALASINKLSHELVLSLEEHFHQFENTDKVFDLLESYKANLQSNESYINQLRGFVPLENERKLDMSNQINKPADDSPGAVVQPPHVKNTSGPETPQQKAARLASKPIGAPGGFGPPPGTPAPKKVTK